MGYLHLLRRHGIVLLQAGLTSLLLASHSTVSAAPSIQGQRFQDWGGNCATTSNQTQLCYLEQVLYNNGSKHMISVLGYLPGHNLPTLMFELPANTKASNGFTLHIGQQALSRFQGKCTPQRCTAGFRLNPRMLAQLQQGRDASLRYVPAPHQPPVELPLSLMGIRQGLTALQQPQR